MEDAQERRARLKAMREAAGAEDQTPPEPKVTPPQQDNEETQPPPQKKKKKSEKVRGGAIEEPVLKFRNYNVRDSETINHTVLDPARPPEFKEPEVDLQLQSRPEDLANMVDKKPNQDLRRDVEKSLAKLERRTQRALVKIAQNQALEAEA